VRTIFIGGVERGFSQGKRKDQPAVAGIHGLEAENIAKECAVGFSVLGVNDYVSTGNHTPLLRRPRDPLQAASLVESPKFEQLKISNLKLGQKSGSGFGSWNNHGGFCAADVIEAVVGANRDGVFACSEIA